MVDHDNFLDRMANPKKAAPKKEVASAIGRNHVREAMDRPRASLSEVIWITTTEEKESR